MSFVTNEPVSTSTSKVLQPKPTDFDTFLPWACKEYSIDADVFVNRVVQKLYVPTTITKKKFSAKSKKQWSKESFSEDFLHSSLFDMDTKSNENIITVETYYNSNENLAQLKLLKNKAIPRKFMQIIALTLPYQKHLTSITINSGLCMNSLDEISKFLPNSFITELCLDSTFISEANYYTLLKNSKLKHLSLAKCTINDAVVKTIADQLKYPCPASKVLSALNLSSNRITDVGAKYLADMLRTNRQLSYLNLAGNMITDEGGISILDTLHEFPLKTQELTESRASYVAYLRKKDDLMNKLIIELQTAKFDKSPKKMLKKPKMKIQSQQNLLSQKSEGTDSGNDAQIIQEKAEILAESTMGLFNDPFFPNNIKTQDGAVHCFGNNTLCYLNVAYNNLTYASVKKLLEVLSTQKSLNRTPRGLIKVVIEGNLMPIACKEYGEIDQLLELGTSANRKHSDSAKKKVVSSRSVAK